MARMLPLLSCVFSVTLCVDCQYANFNVHPQNLTVNEGTNVKLTCWSDQMKENQNCTMPRHRWMREKMISYRPERIVACFQVEYGFNNSMTVDFDEGLKQYSLNINNAQPQDSGEYFCRLYYSHTSTQHTYNSYYASLIVTPRPECEVHPDLPPATIGSSVSLTCSLSQDDPAILLTWFQDLPSGLCLLGPSNETQPGRSLSIQRVLDKTDNWKKLSCVAGEDFENGPRCSATPLQMKPHISIAPLSVTVTEGQTVFFLCSLEGVAEAVVDEYKWHVYKDDGSDLTIDLSTMYTHGCRFKLTSRGQILEVLSETTTDLSNSVLGCTVVIDSNSYRSDDNGSLEVVAGYSDSAPTSMTPGDLRSVILGTILGIVVLAIGILLLRKLILKNKQTQSGSRRVPNPSIPPRQERSAISDPSASEIGLTYEAVPARETGMTYENLPEVTFGQPKPVT